MLDLLEDGCEAMVIALKKAVFENHADKFLAELHVNHNGYPMQPRNEQTSATNARSPAYVPSPPQ